MQIIFAFNIILNALHISDMVLDTVTLHAIILHAAAGILRNYWFSAMDYWSFDYSFWDLMRVSFILYWANYDGYVHVMARICQFYSFSDFVGRHFCNARLEDAVERSNGFHREPFPRFVILIALTFSLETFRCRLDPDSSFSVVTLTRFSSRFDIEKGPGLIPWTKIIGPPKSRSKE